MPASNELTNDTETHRTTGGNVGLSRRGFMRAAAATGGVAAVGAGAEQTGLSPVGDAEAVAPLVAGIAIGGAAGLGMLTGAAAGAAAVNYFGDYGELSGTEETADLHRELRSRLIETYGANDSVLTTTNNRVEDARNVAWPAAKKEAVKARNNEEAEQDAKDTATAEVDAHYAQIQKNLLNRATEWANSLGNIFDLHESDSTLSDSPVIRVTGEWDSGELTAEPSLFSVEDTTTELVDGSEFSYKRFASSTFAQGASVHLDPTGFGGGDGTYVDDTTDNFVRVVSASVDPVGTGSTAEWLNVGAWGSVWSAVENDHEQMVSNVNTYVTNLYQTTEAGDLDPSNWLDASTLASELSSDYESTGHYAYAAAEAAIAGVPGEMQNAMDITWEEDAITVTGSIWTEWAPASSGSGSTETPTDTETSTEEGTESAGTEAFSVGQTYDPANTNKLILVSYEYAGNSWIPDSDVWVPAGDGYEESTEYNSAETWGDAPDGALQVGYGELNQPFTVESATNTETGDEIDVVRTESKNHQTADVEVTEDQMTELLDLAEEMRDDDPPAGGVTGGGEDTDWTLIGGIGAVALAALAAIGLSGDS